jgi:hypothetical protein
MTIVTKAGLAEKLRISRSRVTKFLGFGMPKRLDGRVDLEKACQWIIANIGPNDDGVGAVAAAQQILGQRDHVSGTGADLFSIQAAAELLERDPSDLDAALQGVPPDGRDRYQRRVWRLATIVKGLTRYGRNEGDGGDRDFDRLWGDVERADFAVRAAFARLEREPDLGRRRLLIRDEGVPIGRLESALERLTEQGPCTAAVRAMLQQFVIPQLINGALSETLYYGQWQGIRFDDADPPAVV